MLGLCALFACALLPLHAAGLDDLGYTTTDGKVTITDCDESATGELVIPGRIEGNPVTSIGEAAFGNCFTLTNITLPDSVVSIGNQAFTQCFSLASITIGDGVISIGNNAFSACGLKSITIPNSVTSIGNGAFRFCDGLTNITIGSGVTSIGREAFFACESLTNITIPDSITSIGRSAFYACGFRSITIGNGVTIIGEEAFSSCPELASIIIPDSVTSIGAAAFNGSGNLARIIFEGNAPTAGEFAFSGVANGAIAYVKPVALSSFGESGGNWNGLILASPERYKAVTWGIHPDDPSRITSGIVKSVSVNYNESGAGYRKAFAVLKVDGSIISWGPNVRGSFIFNRSYSGFVDIVAFDQGFAGIKKDGSLEFWGNNSWDHYEAKYPEGNSFSEELINGREFTNLVYSHRFGFAALKKDGSVVTAFHKDPWDDYSEELSNLDQGVVSIKAMSKGFMATMADGSHTFWGENCEHQNDPKSDFDSVATELDSGVDKAWFATMWSGCAALKNDGSVVRWGMPNGKDFFSSDEYLKSEKALSSGVTEVIHNGYVFAAIKDDGSALAWGWSFQGGDSSGVADQLSSGVIKIASSDYSFAALKEDGSVVTWGMIARRFPVASELTSGVVDVVGSNSKNVSAGSFAALKDDGSVFTWGEPTLGGDSNRVASDLSSGVSRVIPISDGFLAVKTDGTIVAWGGDGNEWESVGPELSAAAPEIAQGKAELFEIDGYGYSNGLALLRITPELTITSQPSSAEVEALSSVTFSIETSFPSVEYQWRKNGVNITGATSQFLTLSRVTSDDQGEYTCVIIDEGTSILSDEATLVVKTLPQEINFPPLGEVSFAQLQKELNATSTSALPVSYTSSNPSLASVTQNGQLEINEVGRVTITAYQNGDSTYAPAPPVSRELVVINDLSISEQPSSQEVPRFGEAVFSVKGESRSSVTYQWRKNGADIDGAKSAVLRLLQVGADDEASYSCLVSNSYGSIESAEVTLTLIGQQQVVETTGEVDANLSYSVTDNEATIIDCNTSASGELLIPNSIEGNPVTSIGVDTFSDCTSLTGITIPSSVTSIEIRAFDRCTSLASVTIPGGITRIANGAFRDCISLTSITIPDSVTSIGNRTFYNCNSLTRITIGNGVTSIGESAFESCRSLTSFIFKGDAPTVGESAFLNVIDIAVVFVTAQAQGSFGGIGNDWNSFPIQVGDGTPAPVSEILTAIEFSFNSNEIKFSFDAVNDVSYRIEASTDLINWEMIETAIIGEGSRIDRFYSTRDQPNRHFCVKTN